MKYPEIFSPDAHPDWSQFDAIIDVRSPSEFAEDHLPGAINCPVLDDQERIRVGTMYKQIGSFEAKRLGAALVSANIARHLELHFQDRAKPWRPLIYCWRGGNRSGAMAHIFAKIGWPVAQLAGGYKAYRQHVVQTLPELGAALPWRVLCGPTGSGKSRLLQSLAHQGAQVLDLEDLAQHRGSVLGGLPDAPQPAQKMFESLIHAQLHQFSGARPVYVEAESKKIGNLRVPEALIESMRAAPCIDLKLPIAERVRLLVADYVHFITDPSQLKQQLEYLLSLHGREKISRWQALADARQMATLVQALLEEHYDPAYHKSILRNFKQYAQAFERMQAGISAEDFARSATIIINNDQKY